MQNNFITEFVTFALFLSYNEQTQLQDIPPSLILPLLPRRRTWAVFPYVVSGRCLVLSPRLLEAWLRRVAISSLVLFRVGGDVFQCPQDSLGDRRWGWEVCPLWDKAVLVSSVGERDPSTIWCRILVSTLGDLCFLLRVTEVLHVALLLCLNVIPCFIAARHIVNITTMPQYDAIFVSHKERRSCVINIPSHPGVPGSNFNLEA